MPEVNLSDEFPVFDEKKSKDTVPKADISNPTIPNKPSPGAQVVSTAEIAKKLVESLTTIKKELTDWHTESKQNAEAIKKLLKQMDTLTTKIASTDALKAKVEALSSASPTGVSGNVDVADIKKVLNDLKKDNDKTLKEIEKLKEKAGTITKAEGLSDSQLDKVTARIEELAEKTGRVEKIEVLLSKFDAEFFKKVGTELREWHSDTKVNAKEIEKLHKELEKTGGDKGISKDFKKLKADIALAAKKVERFSNLNVLLDKHSEQIEEVYSSIGRGKIELDELDETLADIQTSLAEWGKRNSENQDEIKKIHKDIEKLHKDLRTQDVTKDVFEITENIESLTERLEKLQAEEKELEEGQAHLVEYDEKLTGLVRKAVMTALSREDFSKELDALKEHKKSAQKEGVKSRLAKLRQHLTKAKTPSPPFIAKPTSFEFRDELEDVFSTFKKELGAVTTDQERQRLWDNAKNDLLTNAKARIVTIKQEIEAQRAAGKNVSKVNLLVTKQDIGLVSLETAFALRNLPKSQESVKKITDLFAQIQLHISMK